jgi:DnaJ-class molecular chaperone
VAKQPMNEKVPIPCERCRGTGLIAGIECKECEGKGHRVLIGGKLVAQTRAAVRPQQHGSRPTNRRRPPSR